VREYTEQRYLPAAENYLKRAAKNGAGGVRIIDKRRQIINNWDKIKFGEIQKEVIKDGYSFHVTIGLNGINRDAVAVEVYADGINGEAIEKIRLQPDAGENAGGETIYRVQVVTQRPASDFTARMIANYEGISVPLEDNHIIWQR